MNYVDIGIIDTECRVTFEAENNLDFRLGTGKLRYTHVAREGDLAAITRVSEYEYELRIIQRESEFYNRLIPHAINFIGHKGKKYGYISNAEFLSALR
ncbi:MAG: hypothetical protein EOP48_00925 [Sphingobacteriales bacterium]|nr:MAG: hypothetical protein EOP48_00925 [Sphingobacteriales bacterium]